MSGAVPESLLVEGLDSVCYDGAYRHLPDQERHGLAVWKHENRNFFLHSTRDGRWMFSQSKVMMLAEAGFQRSGELHRGRCPHELPAGSWQAVNGGARPNTRVTGVADERTMTMSPSEDLEAGLQATMPDRLIVEGADSAYYDGTYRRLSGRERLGNAVWKHESSNYFCYATGDGRWTFADDEKKGEGFHRSGELRRGRGPHEMPAGSWQAWYGGPQPGMRVNEHHGEKMLITIHTGEQDADGMLDVVLTSMGGDELAELRANPASLALELFQRIEAALDAGSRKYMLTDGRILETPYAHRMVHEWLGQ